MSAVSIGTFPCKIYIYTGTLELALLRKQIGKFPQRTLIHHSIAHIRDGRLGKPCQRLICPSRLTEIHRTIECHDGKLMTVGTGIFQSLVVVTKGSFNISFFIAPLLLTL